MVEAYLRQSPLTHLGLGARAEGETEDAPVVMSERAFPIIVDLRGRADDAAFMDAVTGTLGVTLPTAPNTAVAAGDLTALWLGPDEWWVIGPPALPDRGDTALAMRLADALQGVRAAVTDVGESRTCIRVAGPRARAVLQKGCPLDFHKRRFAATQCAQSHLSKAPVTIHLAADDGGGNRPVFHVYVLRSFADYVWRWLEDAGREYGVAIVAEATS